MSTNETPTMEFADALMLLREGKVVTRKVWLGNWPISARRLVLEKGVLFIKYHSDQYYSFSLTSEDVLADDWQEYVP